MPDSTKRLITACQEIADHTSARCAGQGSNPCRLPHSCCDASVCELTIRQAKIDWDTELPRTAHPTYPLMAPEGGCTAPPHMRPLCAVHSCVIQAFGVDPKDPAWSRQYWKLRRRIETLLAERSGLI